MPILKLYNTNAGPLPDTYHPYTLQRVKINATLETSTHKDICGWCTNELCKYEVEEVELVFDWKPIWYSTFDYVTGEDKDDYDIYTYERYTFESKLDEILCNHYHKPKKEAIFDDNENLLELYFGENNIDYWMSVLPVPEPMSAFTEHDRCDTCNESLAKGLFGGDYKYTIHKVEILKRFELNELRDNYNKNNNKRYKCAHHCLKCNNNYYGRYDISPHIIHKIKRLMRKPYPNTDKYVYGECKKFYNNTLQQFANEMNIDTKNDNGKRKTKNELYEEIITALNTVREGIIRY